MSLTSLVTSLEVIRKHSTFARTSKQVKYRCFMKYIRRDNPLRTSKCDVGLKILRAKMANKNFIHLYHMNFFIHSAFKV